jgi:hypothetical protein
VRTFRSRSLAAFAFLSASLALSSAAQASTLAVDDDGVECPTAPYRSIQSAVDAARPGDTVAVCPGDYVEGDRRGWEQRAHDSEEPDDPRSRS